jgi:hypothetical protein
VCSDNVTQRFHVFGQVLLTEGVLAEAFVGTFFHLTQYITFLFTIRNSPHRNFVNMIEVMGGGGVGLNKEAVLLFSLIPYRKHMYTWEVRRSDLDRKLARY